MNSKFRDLLDSISPERQAEIDKEITDYLDAMDSITLDHLNALTHEDKISYYAEKGIEIEMLPEIYDNHTAWRPILTWYYEGTKIIDDAGCLSSFEKIADEAFRYAEYILLKRKE